MIYPAPRLSIRLTCGATTMENGEEKMTIREQVRQLVSGQARAACIYQHTRNIHTLYAMPDGDVYWSENVSTSSWDVLPGTATRVAVIYRTGTGRCGCSCDACRDGVEYARGAYLIRQVLDPAEWAGDDAADLVDELIANMDFIEVGYFDDEQEAARRAARHLARIRLVRAG